VRGDLSLGRRQEHDTADLGQLQGRSHVERGKHGFDGDGVRLELLDETPDQEVDLTQADGERDARRKLPGAEAHGARVAALELDYAEARGTNNRGVHAQDAQLASASTGMNGMRRHLGRHKFTCGVEAEGSVF